MHDKGKEVQRHGRLRGRYANYFEVGHNAFEFLIDIGESYPESSKPRLHTRIVTAPVYANALLDTLRGSIAQYEQTFGSIPKE